MGIKGEEGRRGSEREGRQQTEKKRVCNIFKGEKERRNTAETHKSMQVCAYTFHKISWRVGSLLHFLLYILEGYYIYLYIYIIPINVYFSFKVNVLIIYSLLYIDR